MNEISPAEELSPITTTEVIREVCQQNQTEPGAIWAALEAKGVDTTPGMIYQVFNSPAQPPHADQAPTSSPEPGLGAEDLTLLGALAKKAGGFEQLIRILTVWQETPR